jgi:hypothetical protein
MERKSTVLMSGIDCDVILVDDCDCKNEKFVKCFKMLLLLSL